MFNKNNIPSFKSNYERSRLIRVNRKNPCPICNRHYWE